jgi:hypothetical protein
VPSARRHSVRVFIGWRIWSIYVEVSWLSQGTCGILLFYYLSWAFPALPLLSFSSQLFTVSRDKYWSDRVLPRKGLEATWWPYMRFEKRANFTFFFVWSLSVDAYGSLSDLWRFFYPVSLNVTIILLSSLQCVCVCVCVMYLNSVFKYCVQRPQTWALHILI